MERDDSEKVEIPYRAQRFHSGFEIWTDDYVPNQFSNSCVPVETLRRLRREFLRSGLQKELADLEHTVGSDVTRCANFSGDSHSTDVENLLLYNLREERNARWRSVSLDSKEIRFYEDDDCDRRRREHPQDCAFNKHRYTYWIERDEDRPFRPSRKFDRVNGRSVHLPLDRRLSLARKRTLVSDCGSRLLLNSHAGPNHCLNLARGSLASKLFCERDRITNTTLRTNPSYIVKGDVRRANSCPTFSSGCLCNWSSKPCTKVR